MAVGKIPFIFLFLIHAHRCEQLLAHWRHDAPVQFPFSHHYVQSHFSILHNPELLTVIVGFEFCNQDCLETVSNKTLEIWNHSTVYHHQRNQETSQVSYWWIKKEGLCQFFPEEFFQNSTCKLDVTIKLTSVTLCEIFSSRQRCWFKVLNGDAWATFSLDF